MERKDETRVYLTAIYQNCRTGIQSLEDIMTKIDDLEFKKLLAEQQDDYIVITRKCEELARKNDIQALKDNNWFEKAKLWGSINMSTITDKSTRKIAELLLLGTFMGYLTCVKDEFDHKGTDKAVDELMTKLKDINQFYIEKLLPYLS